MQFIMIESRTGYIGISILIIIRLFFFRDGVMLVPGCVLIVFAFTLVRFNEFWAEYLLPWGLMAYFATDFKTPGDSSVAVALLGWVILLTLGALIFFF